MYLYGIVLFGYGVCDLCWVELFEWLVVWLCGVGFFVVQVLFVFFELMMLLFGDVVVV